MEGTNEIKKVEKVSRDRRVRAYPYPFKAWVALSSDPDNTTIADWKELDQVIWKELGLPFADSFFLRSFNQNLPDQVSLERDPEILAAHPHDTIHTWGDHVWAGKRGFDRSDAVEGLETLRRLGAMPRVWVDHSMFMGNMLHNHRYGAIPEFKDAAGYTYPNPVYSLDLVHEAGVRYLWDGTITPVLGQDRPLSLVANHRARNSSLLRAMVSMSKHGVGQATGSGSAFRAQFPGNTAYRPHRFPDGRTLYVFQRYGKWPLADIDGLGELLAPARMAELERTGGVCIVYTHLGKRPASRASDPHHVPDRTKDAFIHLKERWTAGGIALSSVSDLLDHLVIRDRIEVDERNSTIRFVPDGIAFLKMGQAELAGRRFSFSSLSVPADALTLMGSNGPLAARLEEHGKNGFSLTFDRE